MDKKTLLFQIRQMLKQAVQNLVLPVCYDFNRFRRIRPELIVFADAHHDSRPAAMELLYRAVKKDGHFRIREVYHDYGKCSEAAAVLHSIRFMKLYAQAGTVVICDNFLPAASCRKKSRTKVVQLWHACGCYKKFGYDARDDIPEGYHGNVFRNTDFVTVSGDAAVSAFCSAMRLQENQVKAVGVSRTDLYFSSKWRERCRRNFYKMYPHAMGKKIVLWAPTFRGNAHTPSVEMPDPQGLSKELGEDYFVITRLHPHLIRQLEKNGAGGRKTPFSGAGEAENCPIPTEELYPITDVLIADYSSLIYEYLLFGKSIVLYVPDLAEYEKRRGFYMDIRSIPGEMVMKREDLAGAVLRAAGDRTGLNADGETERADDAAWVDDAAREAFLKTYMGACDGHATQRILKCCIKS